MKVITLIAIIFSNVSVIYSQNIDGTYFSFELNELHIDTCGKLMFYMMNKFPHEIWFHKVTVKIKGEFISIDKTPVVRDSLGKKSFSSSDGGFLKYEGKITKIENLFVAQTWLVDCDYIGLSPNIGPPGSFKEQTKDKSRNSDNRGMKDTLNYSKLELFKLKDGRLIYLLKGTIKKDYIIRNDSNSLWINNQLFFKEN